MFLTKIFYRLALAALLMGTLPVSPSMAQSQVDNEKASVGEKISSFRTRLKQKLWRSPQEEATDHAQAKVQVSPSVAKTRSPQRQAVRSAAVAQATYQETRVRASPSSFRRPEELRDLEEVPALIDAEELPPMRSPMQDQRYSAEQPRLPPSQPAYGSRDASSMAGSGTRNEMVDQSPYSQMPQEPPLSANNPPAMQIEKYPDAQAQRYTADTAMQHDQRLGHYRNGNPRVRTAANSKQMTASQRVLRLQAENQQLIEMRNALRVENKRYNEMLKESRQTLVRIEASIEKALEQLAQANEKNVIQQQRIAELESENQKQVAESQRLLDSIRTKLDDVLIREITSK